MIDELSMDARIVLKSWFGWGPKTTVTVGGQDAQSVLTDRGKAAVDELIAAGFITAEPVLHHPGRMSYRGTSKTQPRLTEAEMREHGKWSATGPNPARKGPANG
ncbi:hypothetical protein [Aureimonas sp. AU40]|uniref:hypothetical protein n=1 Tax=Aureimonas sp. AU40 TaxID=1637747 RepID=UPI000AA05EBC|nr:hypothetical protein [Aureimonas sp. AU40]